MHHIMCVQQSGRLGGPAFVSAVHDLFVIKCNKYIFVLLPTNAKSMYAMLRGMVCAICYLRKI